jgi:hypothetical protein
MGKAEWEDGGVGESLAPTVRHSPRRPLGLSPARPFAAVALAVFAAGANTAFTAKLDSADPPAVLARPIRQLLDPRSLLVRAGTKSVMRVWFRREIPVRASAEQIRNGLTYRHIPEGTLVGALELPQTFTDYRSQRIPAGIYTLRFALQPDTGDHTGTSPHPEFCLLCPAAEDRSAGEMATDALIELSSKVNQGRHPAVLLLWPNSDPHGSVTVLDKGNDVRVATLRRRAAAGDRKAMLGFALTVSGVRKE